MSADPPTAEEIRQWYATRGIEVGKRVLGKRVIDGWNRAHPDRPYKTMQLVHGTSRGYGEFGCRCRPCTDAASRSRITDYHDRVHPPGDA